MWVGKGNVFIPIDCAYAIAVNGRVVPRGGVEWLKEFLTMIRPLLP